MKRNWLGNNLYAILFVLLICSILNGATDLEQYQYAKKNYIAAVFKNDKEKEIKYLKELISYGNKSDQDVSKYKAILHRISSDPSIQKSSVKQTKNFIQNNSYSPISDIQKNVKNIKRPIYISDNSLVIDFNNKINKSDIKFTKTKTNEGHLYKLEVNGSIDDFNSPRLSIDKVGLIEIEQGSDRLYFINILDKEDLKVYYAIKDNRLIVKMNIKDTQEPQMNMSLEKNTYEYDSKNINKKSKIIVIDPGHGGKDSGAVGPNNEYEKDVVLNISQNLADILKKFGYTVYLTRNDDTFIELKDRTKIANKKNADLFISIHANAVPKLKANEAKGIETYFLSPARSERAKRAAALENKEDIEAMDSYSSKDILLTLLNKEKTLASQKLAIDIQRHMLYQLRKTVSGDIIDNGVKEGPFWVLVGAQMPAILVEAGFISHPEESQRLITLQYQQEVANGIAEGITAYFIHNR